MAPGAPRPNIAVMPVVLRSPLGVLVLTLSALSIGVLGLVALRVHQVTHPPRAAGEQPDFEAMMLRVEPVSLRASDGVPLAAWWLQGLPEEPAIVLAHDFGADKASLTHLAVSLRKQGYNLLLIDFRGHGESAAAAASFGPTEKRDLLGAIDHLGERGFPPERIGLYGVGMGAYAALLAAEDRPRMPVLVLDGLYPEASWPMVRRFYSGVPSAREWLDFAPRAWFGAVHLRGTEAPRAETLMRGLIGRDVLLLVSDGDAELNRAARTMIAAFPEQPDADGNLVVLPATLAEGLYGDDLGRYIDHVVEFFDRRL